VYSITFLTLTVLFTKGTYENMVWYCLLLVIGLYFTLVKQVMSSTEITLALSLLEETEARGEMHSQRHNEPFLSLCSGESQQGRQREDLTPNSPLPVLLANGDRGMSESTAGQNSSLY